MKIESSVNSLVLAVDNGVCNYIGVIRVCASDCYRPAQEIYIPISTASIGSRLQDNDIIVISIINSGLNCRVVSGAVCVYVNIG